jgi:RNA polymerase sigma factor (TIGR02999 family)
VSHERDDTLGKLTPLVYRELRYLARQYLKNEGRRETLQTTALVHEAYFKLAGRPGTEWEGRSHFFRAAAQAMRRILVDHARARGAAKRDFGQRVSLNEDFAGDAKQDLDVLALDKALEALSQMDPRKASIVELRYFAGLSVESTGEVLGISPATVKREWVLARLWLFNELSGK